MQNFLFYEPCESPMQRTLWCIHRLQEQPEKDLEIEPK